MRGMNKVVVSGNVSDDVQFLQNGSKDQQTMCTFFVASDRHSQGNVTTTWIKVNVYMEALVNLCRNRLHKGTYVMVEGEITNRGEVRARELIFLQNEGRSDSYA